MTLQARGLRPTRRAFARILGGTALAATMRRKAGALTGPSVVAGQTPAYTNNGSGNTVVLTFPSTPTAGNIMLAWFVIDQTAGPNIVAPPAGWVNILTTSDNVGQLFWKAAQAGESRIQTFTLTTANHWYTGCGAEITGADASSPANSVPQIWNHTYSGSGLSTVNPGPLTPSRTGMLPLVFVQATNGWPPIQAVPTGWTIDNSMSSSYAASAGAHGPVTTDTVTPVSPAISNYHGQYLWTAMALVAPSAAPAIQPRHSVKG